MIICKECGRENEDGFKFCLGCGTALVKKELSQQIGSVQPQMIDCPHCGTQVPSQFKFCGACGGTIPSARAQSSDRWESTGRLDPGLRVDSSGGREVTAQRAPAQNRPLSPETTEQPLVTHSDKPAVGRMIVIRPDGSEGMVIPLVPGEIVLGRECGFDALSQDMFLSPRHASIIYDEGAFVVRDHASLNGVFLRIHDDIELCDGDEIRIGQELLRYQSMKATPAAVPRSSEGSLKIAGSPDLGYWGRLSLMSGLESSSRVFALNGDEVTIGREVGHIVFRDDGFVSGKHARVFRKNDTVRLQDLGSSNGTYIRVRGEQRLYAGDLLLMGQYLFRLDA